MQDPEFVIIMAALLRDGRQHAWIEALQHSVSHGMKQTGPQQASRCCDIVKPTQHILGQSHLNPSTSLVISTFFFNLTTLIYWWLTPWWLYPCLAVQTGVWLTAIKMVGRCGSGTFPFSSLTQFY